MNRSIIAIALAALLSAPAMANDVFDSNLVAVAANQPTYVAEQPPTKVRATTQPVQQPQLDPLLQQMERDLSAKIGQQVDASLAPADR